MGPKKPEIEYIHLRRLAELRQNKSPPEGEYKEAYESLRKLAQGAMKKGPFSVTIGKSFPHIAASGDPRDFLSYAPMHYNNEEKDGQVIYVRRDGKRNPDCSEVKDQSQLEALAENLTFLCLGYFLLHKSEYANHAISLINTFFINSETRMNPHVDYGQVVRGANNPTGKGRAEGIISTRFLARVANVLPLLEDHEGYASVQRPTHLWYANYLQWLLESPIGKKEAAKKNNHHTFYLVQVAAIQQLLYAEGKYRCFPAQKTIQDYYTNVLPQQINKKTGNQPLEASRTLQFHYLEFNLHAAIFLAELGIDAACCDVYCQQQLIPLAATHMIGYCNNKNMKEDMTEGVRTVEIIKSRYGDTDDHCYTRFLEMARHCKDAENISGPKNAIARLWFRKNPQYNEISTSNEINHTPAIINSSGSSSGTGEGGRVNSNIESKGSKVMAFFDKMLHHHH
ncbi:hypothetical protein INT45_003962 [Circinella minor]|uniref:Alginate lyase domain-containing protein n=1 Tax=Circinella minor TaxID=1195481 RepID=A0A8H7RXK4_9FUNG|nr:hypothetical protein INT45_003962 [Circinella minor]